MHLIQPLPIVLLLPEGLLDGPKHVHVNDEADFMLEMNLQHQQDKFH